VPSDTALITPLFSAINECQALHPDPASENEDDFDDEDGEEDDEYEEQMNGHTNGDHFQDADEVELQEESADNGEEATADENGVRLTERGRQILRRLNINYLNQGTNEQNEPSESQFEDAM
jgi:hypothetical protein